MPVNVDLYLRYFKRIQSKFILIQLCEYATTAFFYSYGTYHLKLLKCFPNFILDILV